MGNLFSIIGHQKSCASSAKECQLNSLLLEYFIQAELTKTGGPSEVPPSAKKAKSEGNNSTEEEKTAEVVCGHASDSSSAVAAKKTEAEGTPVSNQKVMKITDCPHTTRKHYAKVFKTAN